MKYLLTLLICLSYSFFVISENSFTITGSLLDKNTQETIEFATVQLLNAKDSSFVKGEMSGKSGLFSFRGIPQGKYILNVTFLGYKPYYQSLDLIKELNLGQLYLSTNDILLKEAVIEGKAAEVVVKNDTIEYNPDAYKTQDNAVVEDLLKKLPGVEVDKDGKITVNGKEVKKFLVDGKEFFSDDPKVASKNIPIEMVERLQVMDRKSDMSRMTGFDDGEEETVINLTVKADMKKGLMGNAMAGYGHDINGGDGRYEAGALVNQMKDNDRYTLMITGNNTNNMGASDLGGTRFGGMRGMRRGSGGINTSENFALNMNKEFSPKLSLNSDISYNGSDRNSSSDVKNKTYTNIGSLLDQTISSNKDISDNFGINLRLEWNPDTSNTFIFRPNFSYNKSNSKQDQIFGRFNGETLDTLYDGRANSLNSGEGYNIGGSIEYAHRFKKMGRVFSVSLTGSFNDSYSEGSYDSKRRLFVDRIFDRDSVVNQRSENDYNSSNYRIFTSYVEPLGKNYFVQLAYRVSVGNTNNINSTYDLYGYDPLSSVSIPVDTAVLSDINSRSTARNTVEQRFSLNIKSVRPKYNYTLGINIDPTKSRNETFQPSPEPKTILYIPVPYDDRLPNEMGDISISDIPQDVINFSPIINFNYLFGKRTNLRVDYSGNTIQPTAQQLLDYPDISDPMNVVRGNPNLKPGYTNNLSARFNKFVPESQLFYNVDVRGNLSLNDITAVTVTSPNGYKETTYENINGNWDMRLRAMFNTPLKNKKFTIGDFTMMSYENGKSYSNKLLTTMKQLSLTNRGNATFRSTLYKTSFELGMNAMINYRNISYDIRPKDNQETFDWGAGGSVIWYFPHNFTVDSDINWTARSGYSKGFNISETIWNASLSKQVFNKKLGEGSIRLKIYDILQNRNNISGSSSTNGYKETRTTTIPSFFMCSFIYKFSIFPGGKAPTDEEMGPGFHRGWRDRGPR